MSADAFLETAEFKEILDQYYPTALHDHEIRWRAYEEELRPYSQAVQAASEITEQRIILPLISSHPGRFVCCLDRQSGAKFTKSPLSIDDKIFRYFSGKKVAGQEPPTSTFKSALTQNKENADYFLTIFFHKLPQIMADLARFRIIANFLTDIQDLVASFQQDDGWPQTIKINPNIEDRIENDRWEKGAGGHRAVHIQMEVQLSERSIPVEVLIMSVLELGWYAKAHMLYELMRQGCEGKINKTTRLKVRAMSDMLYVADSLFDDIYRAGFEEEVTE